ncbi:hypothetical protein PanWU01x14_256650, partial [Parasponia andersonii]
PKSNGRKIFLTEYIDLRITLPNGNISCKSCNNPPKLLSDHPLTVLSLYKATIANNFVYFVQFGYNGVSASSNFFVNLYLPFLYFPHNHHHHHHYQDLQP